jgi:hypothetical protein
MQRRLRVLFRRDPSRDHQRGRIHYNGYQILWPDGTKCAVSLESFCLRGQRLLGLDRSLQGRAEREIDLVCFSLRSREEPMTRLPGHRVRRFCLHRQGNVGRLHFLDGTPTDTAFLINSDDPRAIQWIGLDTLADGARKWVDVAACTVVEAVGRRDGQGRVNNGAAATVDLELTTK